MPWPTSANWLCLALTTRPTRWGLRGRRSATQGWLSESRPSWEWECCALEIKGVGKYEMLVVVRGLPTPLPDCRAFTCRPAASMPSWQSAWACGREVRAGLHGPAGLDADARCRAMSHCRRPAAACAGPRHRRIRGCLWNARHAVLPPRCAADRPPRPLVLVGDCNNTVPSHKRGGGGVVVEHPHLWELLRGMAVQWGTP